MGMLVETVILPVTCDDEHPVETRIIIRVSAAANESLVLTDIPLVHISWPGMTGIYYISSIACDGINWPEHFF
jgi:hypothetical protein